MAKNIDCKGFDLEIWKDEWSWTTFQGNFKEASLCEIGGLLIGAEKSAEEKLFSMAEAWAKKAAIAYLDGISAGAFSLLMGSTSDSGTSLGMVVDQIDQIVERYFEQNYRRLFEDEKSSYFEAYDTYIQGTASFPFGNIVDKVHNPALDITELESVQLDHVLRSLERFEAAGSSLIKQSIFGQGVPNRFRAAGVFMLIMGQRLEVWKQLDFALQSEYTRNILTTIRTLEAMHDECTNWLNERIGPVFGGSFRGGRDMWGFTLDGRQRLFHSKHDATRKRRELIKSEYVQNFGENHEQILSYWKEIAARV